MSQTTSISAPAPFLAGPTPGDASEVAHSKRPAPTARGVRALIETTKPGITRLVTMTSLAGFGLAAMGAKWGWGELALSAVACGAGTALSAAGANALNQYMERDRDARMDRTQSRPLPSGRTTSHAVLWTGIGLCIAGLGVLLAGCGLVALTVSLACIVSYLAVYTPLKPRTALATFVGALPGALPPMIGAAAASSAPGWHSLREPAGLALFSLMFVWQIPHFLAIAWMYRDDYAKGGYAVLPVVDPSSAGTAWTIALWTAALVPASVLPAILMPDLLGGAYITIAVVSGIGFCVLAARLLASRSRARARQLFFGSIAHLPLLLIAMTAEGVLRGWLIRP